MDMDRRFPHYTPPVRELLERSYKIASAWQSKPHKNAKTYDQWEKNFQADLNKLSETMTLFGLEIESKGKGKPDENGSKKGG